jgi:hypothetical protein
MGRGPKPAKGKAKPAVARKSPKNDAARVRDLEKRLAEALQQQTATGEILRVISSSPNDVQPVFDAIAESAARLCESSDADIWRRADDRLLLVAHYGAIPVGPVAELGQKRGPQPSRPSGVLSPPHERSLATSAALVRSF